MKSLDLCLKKKCSLLLVNRITVIRLVLVDVLFLMVCLAHVDGQTQVEDVVLARVDINYILFMERYLKL
ncbi:hypothetical protein [uncultured Parabacteroides sp.]|uniref:hypothetical protein n=1 Tax=uncultured Parabacteroides sp. TaxID=512312 RepID=UPI00259B40BB|nr:hypothetical protein [uncultured Parabacteroides sp.]